MQGIENGYLGICGIWSSDYWIVLSSCVGIKQKAPAAAPIRTVIKGKFLLWTIICMKNIYENNKDFHLLQSFCMAKSQEMLLSMEKVEYNSHVSRKQYLPWNVTKILTCQKMSENVLFSELSDKYLQKWVCKASVYAGSPRVP